MNPPLRSVDVRQHVVEALEADFVGPFNRTPGETWSAAPEVLPRPPSRWYLTGFLAPQEKRELEEDPTSEEELAAGDDMEDEESPPTEPGSKRSHRMPASMGLTVLLPPGEGDSLRVTVRYADYVRHEPKRGPDGKRVPGAEATWERVPRQPAPMELPLQAAALREGVEVEGSRNLRVMGHLAPANAPGLPPGTRAVSVFLVNYRKPAEGGAQDEQIAFQVWLEVSFARGLQPRPNRRDHASEDSDAATADLQFRGRMEYAVGHGVSVAVVRPAEGGPATTARTTWIPRHEVPRVVTQELPAVKTAMEELAALPDGAAARAALSPLLEAYGAWISQRRQLGLDSPSRAQERDRLLGDAERARQRMARGLEMLERDADVLAAFQLANEAMARAAYKRNPARYQDGERPRWRLFQLAFLLLNLPCIADGAHPDRRIVELIFFPTGGGKTEAYLGVIAFTLVLRRLRGLRQTHEGLGLAVLLRYTLRLLTLDQLGRAASLICALEMLRKADPKRLGAVRFAIGLWVGRSATANTFTEVAKRITDYKNNPSENAPSPFPLSECPWCLKPLTRDSLALVPNKTNPTDVIVGCADFRCEFSAGKNAGEGLPVLFVDEQIYRELPSFLVATVDKFALLPWRGETGMLFGRVFAREGRRFYGPMEPGTLPLTATRLPAGVPPPELIVQDELHLISGPLGSMVGLYETAIDALCSRPLPGGGVLRPKVIASTATVRRARAQVQSLFGRSEVALFPPPGPDDSETFFAQVDRASPGRLYLGVAAPGRSMKAVLLRTYIALLGAAWRTRGGKGEGSEAADPYLTLAGYFNSLRELGGMRRLVEDEVRTRLTSLADRRPQDAATHPWLANRVIEPHPVELTSREPTAAIARAKAQLARKHGEKGAVDVLLASNMISVGVDIDRLGLMVIAGQPKTTSEYIQASSRVGRDASRPGLVVTVLNLHKPRDRSHYERFAAYHDCFYRFVEATSVTPFSAPALERGLAALLLAMTRLAVPELTPPRAVMELERHRARAEEAAREVAERAGGSRSGMSHEAQQELVENLVKRGRNLLDAWQAVMDTSRKEAGGVRAWSPWDKEKPGKPLLLTRLQLDEDKNLSSDERKFVAPSSMRDVEPTVHLWVERSGLGGRRSGHGR